MPKLSEFSGELLSKQSTVQFIKEENLLLINVNINLNANQSNLWNVATLLDTKVTQYDLTSISIEAFVKDVEVGSDTKDYWVAADNIAAIGWKDTGEVYLKNLYTSTLSFKMRIRVNKKAS